MKPQRGLFGMGASVEEDDAENHGEHDQTSHGDWADGGGSVRAGTRVSHPEHGLGKIIMVDRRGMRATASVLFDSGKRVRVGVEELKRSDG